MNLSSKRNILLNLIHGFRFNVVEGLHSSRYVLEKNYYDVLNLKKGCSPREVRESFIILAKKYHPDTNPEDPNSHARFVELQKAYSVLSSPSKRIDYDLSLDNFPVYGSSPHGNPKRRTDGNEDYEYHFNEEYREYFHRSRQTPDVDNSPPRVGPLQVTVLLLAFTTVGAVAQYLFLKWLYVRSNKDEMEKHQRGTAAFYALKGEMEKQKEDYDIRKLRLAYFKEVGHGAINSNLVPSLIREEFNSEFRARPAFQEGYRAQAATNSNSKVEESFISKS